MNQEFEIQQRFKIMNMGKEKTCFDNYIIINTS